MEFEFKHTDDFSVILSRRDVKTGKLFERIVDKIFSEIDEEENLLFCLLEIATIPNQAEDVLGERFLYSIYTPDQGEYLLGEYTKIVKKVKDKFGFGISEFQDWYNRKSFILNISNNSNYSTRGEADWKVNPKDQEHNRKKNKYLPLDKKGEKLTDKKINEYLSFYAEILHTEEPFKLKQYPNYCIIVKPISARKSVTDPIPLGNFYLHFATRSPKDEDFYLRLLNELTYVWLIEKGAKIIKKVKKDAQEEISIEEEVKKYIPNFNHLHGIGKMRLNNTKLGSEITLESYYREYFKVENNREVFESNLTRVKDFALPKFSNWTEHPELDFRDLPKKVQLNTNQKFFERQGIEGLKNKDEYEFDCFQKLLIKRAIFKIGFLKFDIDPRYLCKLLKDGITRHSDSIWETDQNVYGQIWTELFIPWLTTCNINNLTEDTLNKLKNRIEQSFSDVEKEFIEDL